MAKQIDLGVTRLAVSITAVQQNSEIADMLALPRACPAKQIVTCTCIAYIRELMDDPASKERYAQFVTAFMKDNGLTNQTFVYPFKDKG